MLVRVAWTAGAARIDTDRGDRESPMPIPCHRCGVCCERWQPLLTPEDAARLAGALGLTPDRFLAAYTDPYPFDDERRLLRRQDGRCVFLRYEAGGRSACAVHDARPMVCREWRAGLNRRECVKGLERFARAGGLIPLAALYDDGADGGAFAAAAGDDEG